MCGRFSFAISDRIIEDHYGFVPSEMICRYNCAPSQLLAVITDISPGKFSFFKWGFIPFWAKDASVGNKMINARAETINSKPAFKKSLQTMRCLVPADSFYEWSDKKDKKPYRIMLKNQPVFSMAGIWSEWKSPDNEIISSFAVITTEANEITQQIHHRMPVIFDTSDAEKSWLKNAESGISSLLKPLESEKMTFYPVSKKVNSPKNDFPEIHLQETEQGLF
ncbi:MAG TPA: SOS response-associated peptidase [Bacteroidales bacterium]|nr:SOS response-associated peptidase [Bacteroidales bacterium]